MDQSQSTVDFFVGYIQDPEMVFTDNCTLWFIIIAYGVEKGIEAWAKVMMLVIFYVFGIISYKYMLLSHEQC